jgi:hypothetical protein
MNKIKSVLFMAGILLALAFTLSCSSGGGNSSDGDSLSSSVVDSSSSSNKGSSSSSSGVSSSGADVSSSSNGGNSSSSSGGDGSSSSSSGGNGQGVSFNENSQIYNEDGTLYKGSGVIKLYASGEYYNEILIDAGIVIRGVVNLNLSTNILDEYLYDFLNDDEQSSCTSYPKDIKVIGRYDKGYDFELSDNNGKYIGSLSLHYRDEQIFERIEYVYFSKAGKIACNLQDKGAEFIYNIDAKKGWNVLYSSYNRSQDKKEISTNNILTKEKEMKWKIYLED